MKNTHNALTILSRTCRGAFTVAFITVLLAVSLTAASAQTYTLSVSDSSIQVNTSSGGLSDWVVGGLDQLGGQSFYYSVGTTEYPISQIASPSALTFGGSSFGGVFFNTNMSVTYASSTLSVTTGYELEVQGTGAELASTITIHNLSSTSQTLEFYQLSDFTLGGVSSGQNVQFAGTTPDYLVTQTGSGALMTGYLSGLGLGTSITVGEMAGTGNLGLGNSVSPPPTFGNTPLSQSGSDVAYGYEFEVTIPGDSGIGISEIQTVPEPSSVALFSFGLFGLALLRRYGLAFLKKS